MIRLTWMQWRLQMLAVGAALAIVAVILAITGPSLHQLYTTTILDCHAHGDCPSATSTFLRDDSALQSALNDIVLIIPALIGLFWGAPLVAREFETHTGRLVWTMTTRSRWVAVRLVSIGIVSMLVAGAVSLIVTWWSSPLDSAHLTPFATFDQRGLVPIGYAAFAFVVGVTVGLLIRRTVPAMATALVVFVAARVAVAQWVRPRLFAPVRRIVPDTVLSGLGSVSGLPAPNPRDWVISDLTVNASGRVIGTVGSIGSGSGTGSGLRFGHGGISQGVVLGPGYSCPNIGSHRSFGSFRSGQLAELVQRCVSQLHIREVLTYEPIGHYWPLQWCELGVFLAAAVLLGWLCFWRIRSTTV